MTATARVIKEGRNQSVRLPRAFRLKSTTVQLRHTPEGILITERDRWDDFEDACQKLSGKFLHAMEKRTKARFEARQPGT